MSYLIPMAAAESITILACHTSRSLHLHKSLIFSSSLPTRHVPSPGTLKTLKSKLKERRHGVTKLTRAAAGEVSIQETEKVERLSSNEVAVLGFDVVAQGELRDKGFMGMPKTKLVCTIGPACCSIQDLERLAWQGMNIARLNMCHGSREWHRESIRKIKRLNHENGFCVSIMIDTGGGQIHVVDHGSPSTLKAEEGSMWLFTSEMYEGCRPFTVKASYPGFSEGIIVGDEVVIDGGMASFEVIEKKGNDLLCKCTDPGLFLPRAKSSFWRNGELLLRNYGLPSLSEKDWDDIEFGISEGVDLIAMSFVNGAESVKHLRKYISEKSTRSVRVLAKVETLESLQHLEEIVEASDGIMVARGDLGVEVPLEQIPGVQKEITSLCRKLNKPVIIASQLLQSMVEYPTPTRAEVADVSEGVRQYADALMLSGESAIGSYSHKALSVLRMVCNRMETSNHHENRHISLVRHKLGGSLADCVAEEMCNSAVTMANNLGVDAIFAYTRHGEVASLLSRNRPNLPILAFTDDESTRMRLNMQWGVVPVLCRLSDDMEANVTNTIEMLRGRGVIREGDVILVVSDLGDQVGKSEHGGTEAAQAIQQGKIQGEQNQ
ncbi:Pyruvate kinase isozyme A, chloroplastic, partial [Linum perenne]